MPMQALIESLTPLRQYGARFGPYVLLELLLPGGTLFALLLFLQQRVRVSAGNFPSRPVAPPVVISSVL